MRGYSERADTVASLLTGDELIDLGALRSGRQEWDQAFGPPLETGQ